jgi:FHA domain
MGNNQRPRLVWPTALAQTADGLMAAPSDEGLLGSPPDRVPLDHGLTVGREAMPGQVVLDHPNVSRRHAAFEIVNGSVMLRDLGGTAPMSTARACAAPTPWSLGTVSIPGRSN